MGPRLILGTSPDAVVQLGEEQMRKWRPGAKRVTELHSTVPAGHSSVPAPPPIGAARPRPRDPPSRGFHYCLRSLSQSDVNNNNLHLHLIYTPIHLTFHNQQIIFWEHFSKKRSLILVFVVYHLLYYLDQIQ